MRAIRFHAHGDAGVLRFERVEAPRPGPGEALLEVRASSVNHLDIHVRRGIPGIPVALPHVPGSDVAGVVVELGPGATGVTVGDRVVADPGLSCGSCEACRAGEAPLCIDYRILGEHVDGTWAERVALPASSLLPVPEGLSWEEAGAVPLVFLTAWRMVVTRAEVRPGEDVLVLGAGSGVGSAAVQIAKLAGARVIATASTDEKRRRALEIGADVAIDYTGEPFDREVRRITRKRGVDVVLDHVGAETWAASIRSLARGGRLVTCGATSGHDAPTDLRHVFFRQLRILGSTMGTRNELAAALGALGRRKLAPVVDSVFPLERAADAVRKVESRDVFGKVVLAV